MGSVLHFASPGDIIWGAGVNGKVNEAITDQLDVRALRGPFSRCAVLRAGNSAPAVFGDPALLFGKLLAPKLRTQARNFGRVAVIPNFHELDRFTGPDVISPIGQPDMVINSIAHASFVTGTSLHGLVIADALGIPNRPIMPTVEHPLKYVDYYAATGRHNVMFANSVAEALDLGPLPTPTMNLGLLEDAFPYDAWELHAQVPTHSSDVEGEYERSVAELVTRIGTPTPQEEVSLDLITRRASR